MTSGVTGPARSALAECRPLVVVRQRGAIQASKAKLRSLCRLTAAEADVADLIAAGTSVTEISENLQVSKATVHNQLAAVMTKMEVNRQAELVAAVAALTIRLR